MFLTAQKQRKLRIHAYATKLVDVAAVFYKPSASKHEKHFFSGDEKYKGSMTPSMVNVNYDFYLQ